MKNEEEKIQQSSLAKSTKAERWFAGYVVAGLIYAMAQNFNKTTVDELIILAVAIGAGFFYHRIKSKIKIKNEAARILATFVLIEIIAGALIGISTAIADRQGEVAVRTPIVSETVSSNDGDLLKQLNQGLQEYLSNFQGQWAQAQNSVEDENNGPETIILGYQNLQKLNNERYTKFISYSEQVKPILNKYSENLADVFSQLVTASEKTKNAYNDVFTAEINFQQGLLDDNETKDEATNKLAAVYVAQDKFNKEQETAVQAQNNWQKAYNDFFGN